jgi:hypothetical protein
VPAISYGAELDRLAAFWAQQPTSTCFAALAEALRKRGALDEAARVVKAGVAARPEYVPGYIVTARICSDRAEWEGADSALETALLLDAENPVALEARRELAHNRVAPSVDPATHREPELPATTLPEDPQSEDEMYLDEGLEGDLVELTAAEPVLTESLAMLYRGQGHLADAVDVLDALVARTPGDQELTARRDALRAEFDMVRPRPYAAGQSGGLPVRRWLSGLSEAHAPAQPAASGLDAFFQPTTASTPSEEGDLVAFQAWLRELER